MGYTTIGVALFSFISNDKLCVILLLLNCRGPRNGSERANKLKEEVGVLFQNYKNIVEKMNLVDVLQRLGIDHHFEEQITTTLHSIHNADFNSGSLNEVSLRFRLLRQQGFWVPPGTIKNTVEPYFI